MKKYYEIADISSSEEKYIKYEVVDDTKETFNMEQSRPLSTYYYEALVLCRQETLTEPVILKLKEYKDKLEIIWNYTNIDYESTRRIIKESSRLIKKLFYSSGENGFISNDSILNKAIYMIDSLINNNINNKCKRILKKSCVAIAYSLCPYFREYYSFFSLSGTSNDYIGNTQIRINGKAWTYAKPMIDAYRHVGNLIKHFFGYDFKDCHLTDSAVRYTKITKDFKYSKVPLKKPIMLINDSKKVFKIKDFPRYYSCCEKKIVNNIMGQNIDYLKMMKNIPVFNTLSMMHIKVLYKPCYMCTPSLVGCNSIHYGFNSVNDLIVRFTQKHKVSLVGKVFEIV